MNREQEIIEGNKLIAEFMGETIIDRHGEYAVKIGNYSEYLRVWARYHTSWDYLMPCLKHAREKVKQSDFSVAMIKEAMLRLKSAYNEVCNVDIENAHFCFVKFIQWYNETINQ